MIAERIDIEEAVVRVAKQVKLDRKLNKKFKELMTEYNILVGTSQRFLNDPEEEIKNLSPSELIIYTLQLYKTIPTGSIRPEDLFNQREIKEATSTFVGHDVEIEEFPFTFTGFIRSRNAYYGLVSVSTLRKLKNGKMIQYNPNTQRNARYVENKEGSLIPEPRTNPKSVREIGDLFEKGELEETMLIFNARLDTADEGVEIDYDAETQSLTVNKGTMFDCLDGYHRFDGTTSRQTLKPDIDMFFLVKIINTTEVQAKRHFTQTNTINPIPKSHKRKMDQSNLANFVTDYIQKNSELGEKITTNNEVGLASKYLTNFGILSETIEKYFDLSNRGDAIKTAKYLTEFFNNLCFDFPDEFLGDVATTKKISYINYPTMFAGYVILAKKMKDEKIPVEKTFNILSEINFSKEDGSFSNIVSLKGSNIRTGIEEYFNNLNLDKYK